MSDSYNRRSRSAKEPDYREPIDRAANAGEAVPSGTTDYLDSSSTSRTAEARANLFAYYHSSNTSAVHTNGKDAAADNLSGASVSSGAVNVYHPREALRAAEPTDQASQNDAGYQVSEVQRKPLKHGHRRLLIILGILAVVLILGTSLYMLREPLSFTAEESVEAADTAVTITPEPVRAYIPAPSVHMTDQARSAIAAVAGTVDMEAYVVTDQTIVTRNRRSDGIVDSYLFSARDGRLIAYYEDIVRLYPQPSDCFYLDQPPYLITGEGKALIRLESLESTLHRKLVLYPIRNGWAMLYDANSGEFNYCSESGQLIDKIWYSHAWPFSGERTVAWMDTGNPADISTRYWLYILHRDGTTERWMQCADKSLVIASVCGYAYLNTGELYWLQNTSAPLCLTAEAISYPDCGAIVALDRESGKYGLYVDGEKHYDFLYDSIQPVACELEWSERAFAGASGRMAARTIVNAPYPQPLSISFALTRGGETQYVALSTLSCYPNVFDAEFQYPEVE